MFDQAAAVPAELRTGPRGGGRDLGKIIEHVAVEAMRAGVLASPSDGGRLAARGWPARYGARRLAWHALDHAWEIEDRSAGPG